MAITSHPILGSWAVRVKVRFEILAAWHGSPLTLPSPREGEGAAAPSPSEGDGKAAHRSGSLWDSGGWGEGGTLNSTSRFLTLVRPRTILGEG
jgi:hypothetical protein